MSAAPERIEGMSEKRRGDAWTGAPRNDEVAGGTSGHRLICRVGDRLLAIGLGCVVETMRPLPLRAFSGAPNFILGVSVIRGAVVPVIDVEAALGVPSTSPGRFVTIRMDDRIVALAVDEVLGVRSLDEATMHGVPPLLGALDEATISAIGTLDSNLLLVLGDTGLVPAAVWAEFDGRVELGTGP